MLLAITKLRVIPTVPYRHEIRFLLEAKSSLSIIYVTHS